MADSFEWGFVWLLKPWIGHPPTRQMRLTLLTTDQGGAVAKGYTLEPVGAEASLYLRAVCLGPGLLTVRFRNILVIQLKKCTILTCQC